MVSWTSLTPDEKLAACKKAVAGGAVTATEVAEALGCGRGAVLGICRRKGVDLFTSPKALKAKAKRATERGRRNIAKANNKRRTASKMVPIKKPTPPIQPLALPSAGEGVSFLEAIETGGCRYAIGDPSDGFDMEVCGKPLTPRDKEKNFHFCASCQRHLINISAQTQARRAANG